MKTGKRLNEIQPKVIFRSGLIFYLLFTVLILQLPFYGDHVSLISAPANYFFDTGFRSLILPSALDTGHPPCYALIHALFWKLFGRNLSVSHLISLSAVLFLFYQFYLCCKKLLNEEQRKIALLFFVVNPTILAQSGLMSADIFLCGLFFYGFNSILSHKTNHLFFAVAVLLLMNVRGIILSGFLIIAVLFFTEGVRIHFKKYFFIFLIASLPAVCWYWFHYEETGWIISNPQSPWAAGREFIGVSNFPAVVFEYIFRYLEFGMIIPWLIILFQLKKLMQNRNSKKLWLFLITGFLFFSLFMIFFKNPVMVRYILPVQIIAMILSAQAIVLFFSSRFKIAAIVFCSIFFIAQHFFAYPRTQSSVFDYSWGEGSLAHLSYFKFRQEGSAYLRENGISADLVHTGFPEYKSFKNTDLADDNPDAYQPFEEAELQNYEYVIYSNIMNGISYRAETELKSHWIRLKTCYEYPVEYIIFQNPARLKNH